MFALGVCTSLWLCDYVYSYIHCLWMGQKRAEPIVLRDIMRWGTSLSSIVRMRFSHEFVINICAKPDQWRTTQEGRCFEVRRNIELKHNIPRESIETLCAPYIFLHVWNQMKDTGIASCVFVMCLSICCVTPIYSFLCLLRCCTCFYVFFLIS